MQNLKDHYIKSLQDGRNVWLYGKKVDVTTDNNFAGTLCTIPNLFSLFDDPKQRDSIG
ncbi:4-hydroxyphenylacetate 3-hydroxylase, partial [Bacillus paranthracis]|nr:4-hydroxyphenylacetate 3-hydroxylase [Bacillus paranthracis]